MLVECIEEAVAETPEEEQDGDNADGINGLPQSQLGRPGAAVVGRLERAILEELLRSHDGRRLDGDFGFGVYKGLRRYPFDRERSKRHRE